MQTIGQLGSAVYIPSVFFHYLIRLPSWYITVICDLMYAQQTYFWERSRHRLLQMAYAFPCIPIQTCLHKVMFISPSSHVGPNATIDFSFISYCSRSKIEQLVLLDNSSTIIYTISLQV